MIRPYIPLTVSDILRLSDLLAGFVRQFGSQTALGKAIDVSPSRLSRLMKGEQSLEVVNCLKLADATGASPSAILRAAGKADVADLIESMYGQSRPAIAPALTPAQREVIDAWEALPGHVQENFAVLLRYARDVALDDARGSRSAVPPESRRRRQPGATRKRAARRGDAKP